MKVLRLIFSLLAGVAISKAVGKKSMTVITDIVTITATFVISDAPDMLWRHRSSLTTMIPKFTNSTSIATQLPTGSLLATQQVNNSANGTSSFAAVPSSSSSSLASYSQPILDQHNNHRANSSALPLIWSSDMANIAAQIASTCIYEHSRAVGNGDYGQNIGAGAEPSAVPALITNDMYDNEIDWYPTPYGNDNPDMTYFKKWGHYSQIVWKSTNSVGCATQYCPNGLTNTGSDISPYFTVCNYSPPGNVAGQYSNVGAPIVGLSNVVLPEK